MKTQNQSNIGVTVGVVIINKAKSGTKAQVDSPLSS